MSLYSQAMVNVQMLSELEEIMQFKLVPERREAIKRTWWNRLQVSDEESVSSSLKKKKCFIRKQIMYFPGDWVGASMHA